MAPHATSTDGFRFRLRTLFLLTLVIAVLLTLDRVTAGSRLQAALRLCELMGAVGLFGIALAVAGELLFPPRAAEGGGDDQRALTDSPATTILGDSTRGEPLSA